jgi:hypothetical protein
MTQSLVRLSRGFNYVTGRLKKSPICHGEKSMKQGNKRTFKIPVTNVTIWPLRAGPGSREKDNQKKELAQDCAGFFFAQTAVPVGRACFNCVLLRRGVAPAPKGVLTKKKEP